MSDRGRALRSQPTGAFSGAAGLAAALLASTCCILPLLAIFAGVAGAGFMATMMRYEAITLPLGVLGLLVGWVSFLRERGQCRTQECRRVDRRVNAVLLGIATLVVAAALVLRFFPSWTAAVLESMT